MRSNLLSLLLNFFLLAALVSCGQKQEEERLSAEELVVDPSIGGKKPVLVFEDSLFDFGQVAAGDIVRHSFTFTNKGEGDLIISNAQASCGCTVPTYPREPIGPGKSGKIDVEFNSTGRSGNQNKTVTVFANTAPPTSELQLTGKVVATPENGPVKE